MAAAGLAGIVKERPASKVLVPIGALLALNLLLGLEASHTAPWVVPSAAVSPDLLVLALAGGLLAGRPIRWPGRVRAGRYLLAAILFLAAALRIAERVALQLLGRPLDPAGDLPHVGNVAGMLATAASDIRVAIAFVGAGIAVAGAAALVFAGLGSLDGLRRRMRPAPGRAIAAVAALLLLVPAVHPPGGSATWLLARTASASLRPAVELSEPPLPPAPDLGGADLLVVFVESYGVAAFDDPERRKRLAAAAETLAIDAEAGGFDFRSAQIQSPTFGGGSWKAHAALLSGVWVDDEERYRALVRSDRRSLVRRLAAAGYRTVAFEPGIQGPWPEGAWYGFDRVYDAAAIGYDGPRIGWWRVPDQFTLYALHNQELADAAQPVFAKVSLIMSHIPYWPVPVYVTPWSRFDDHTAYDGPLRSVAHDDARDQAELSERYVQSLEHQYRILGGFLREFVPRRALVVVIGDHQPPRLSLHDSDTWATPIHLFSQDATLLEPFGRLGFSRTLFPEIGTSWRMSDFPRDLARLFPPAEALVSAEAP